MIKFSLSLFLTFVLAIQSQSQNIIGQEEIENTYNLSRIDEMLQQMESLDTAQLSISEQVRLFKNKAALYLKSNYVNAREKAIEQLIFSLTLLPENEDNASQRAELLDQVGEVYDLLRQKENAKIYFQQAYELRTKAELKAELYRSFINLGMNAYRFGYPLDDAVGLLKKAIQTFEESTPPTDQARGHYWLASALNYFADQPEQEKASVLDSALHHAFLAKNTYLNLKDSLQLIEANNLLVNILTRTGASEKALEISQANLDLIASLESNRGKLAQEYYATTYSNLARAHEANGNYPKALEYSRKQYFEVMGILMNEERTKLAQITEDYRTDKQLDVAEATAFYASRQVRILGFVLAGLGIAFLIAYLIFRQTIQQKKLENLQAMVKGEERERQRLAKDLHDGIGVMLTGIKLRLNAFEDQVENREGFHHALDQIDEACTEVRRVSHNMVPASLTKLGLGEALLGLLDQITHASDIQITQHINLPEGILPSEQEVLLYRVIQELLNNSLKYAEAKTIFIAAKVKSEKLQIIFKDDGQGFDKTKIQTGLGLKSIDSRMDILKGKMTLTTFPGKGTSYMLSIPIPAKT